MLHAQTYGPADAPPVAFLHGFMGSGADWRPIIERLGSNVRAIALDLPGHGASTGLPDRAYTMAGAAEAVAQTLEGLGAAPCTLVGYSMGGRLALYTALHHPGRVRRLVLESASPGLADAAARAQRRTLDEQRAQEIVSDWPGFLERWYRMPLFATLDAHGLVEPMIERRRPNDPAELARVLRGMGTGTQPSLWERLPTLHVSTLALAGARDGRYVEVAERMKLAQNAIHTATVPDAGHNTHAERPDAFADVLRAFLAKPYARAR